MRKKCVWKTASCVSVVLYPRKYKELSSSAGKVDRLESRALGEQKQRVLHNQKPSFFCGFIEVEDSGLVIIDILKKLKVLPRSKCKLQISWCLKVWLCKTPRLRAIRRGY